MPMYHFIQRIVDFVIKEDMAEKYSREGRDQFLIKWLQKDMGMIMIYTIWHGEDS